jgi:hypothetical protein
VVKSVECGALALIDARFQKILNPYKSVISKLESTLVIISALWLSDELLQSERQNIEAGARV